MKDAIIGLGARAALYATFAAVVLSAPESESFAKGFVLGWIVFDFGAACARVLDRYIRGKSPGLPVTFLDAASGSRCFWHEAEGPVGAWVCRTVKHGRMVGKIRTFDGARLDCIINGHPSGGWTTLLPADPVAAADLVRRSMRLVEAYIPEGE